MTGSNSSALAAVVYTSFAADAFVGPDPTPMTVGLKKMTGGFVCARSSAAAADVAAATAAKAASTMAELYGRCMATSSTDEGYVVAALSCRSARGPRPRGEGVPARTTQHPPRAGGRARRVRAEGSEPVECGDVFETVHCAGGLLRPHE